jgi:serine protease AprX
MRKRGITVADTLVNPDPAGADMEDPFLVVYESELVNRQVRARSWVLPGSAISHGNPDDVVPVPPAGPYEKLHPLLRRWLQGPDLNRRDEFIVVFVDQPTVPRFPDPIPGVPPDSPRMLRQRARAEALVRSIQEQRAPRYAELERELTAIEPTLEYRERFWLINGIVVEAPLRAVESIAGSPSVLSIAPRFSGEAPPAYEIREGRNAIRSDPYYNRTLPPSTQIALVDTGVRMTHKLLAGRLGTCFDCVNGGTDCATGPNVDPHDVQSHGTASAAILAGNKSRGDRYRGVSGALVASFRVYDRQRGFDRQAAQRGFAEAAKLLKVVVAEMQGNDGERGDLVVAAESAFDAGAVVVAASGNEGREPGSVRSPASAHRVIGVGAYVLETLGTYGAQGQGPTSDGRFKPDVQGPTSTLSASNASNTATAQFDGTSGATAYVGGAAALLRDWNTAQPGGPSDPGQVYSQLILFGERIPIDPATGAGKLRLNLDGMSWVGKVPVGNGDVIDIDLPVPSGMGKCLDAAIWWPETWQNDHVHNTITLAVADPSGAVSGAASTPNSVFERCFLQGTTSAGTWTVRIRGAAVPTAPQTVYWAAFIPHSTMPGGPRSALSFLP